MPLTKSRPSGAHGKRANAMILAVDVDYRGEKAVVAGVLFHCWSDEAPGQEITTTVSPVEAYVPGQFYRRELPCILALVRKLETLPSIVVVDGHVWLDGQDAPGLGKYVYDALAGAVVVIGVAKSGFRSTPEECAVYRGRSKRPLYVTAVGIDQAVAREHVRTMAGANRIPDLLKRVDRLCRA